MKKIYLIINTLVGIFFYLTFASSTHAWENLTGGDHGGSDWTISTNTAVAGTHTNIGTFTVNTGVTATVQAYDGSQYGTFSVTANSVSIVGTITAAGKGYLGVAGGDGTGDGGGQGECLNISAGGGGHGGRGGSPSTTYYGGYTYGSLTQPTTMGSAGGSSNPGTCTAGSAGGGAIRINSSGAVTISGAINANGAAAAWATGGGAGGSIYISGTTLSGAGSITANGGSGSSSTSGSGGGGRIALHYSSANTLSGTITSSAGSTGNVGVVGTVIYMDDTNNDLTIPKTQYWYARPNAEGTLPTFRDVTINGNSTLYIVGYYTTNTDGVGITINARNFNITSGSSIIGTSLGYQSTLGTNDTGGQGYGQGTCTNNGGGGGGHGGTGANNSTGANLGGGSYGSASAPITLGSAGGGNNSGSGCITGMHGGSAIKINSTGTLTINGVITMDGGNGGWEQGGGAGGSIYLLADILAGSANLSAKGGNGGAYAGGGGGGRISLNYRISTSWAGSTVVTGGSNGASNNSTAATAGTAQTNPLAQLPSNLAQYKSDGTTVISSGATTDETTVVFKTTMSSGGSLTLKTEVEVLPIGSSFTNVPTATGSGVAYSGTPVTGSVTVTGLTDVTNYHWQARVCITTNENCSDWVSSGGSPYDFRVFSNQSPNAPSSLGPTAYTDGTTGNDTTPTFTFSLSDPDAGNTVYYTIQVSTVSDYATLVLQYDSALAAQGSATFTVGQLAGSGLYSQGGSAGQALVNGSYYWRVKTTDNNGAASGWTEGRSGSPAFVIDSSSPSGNATSLAFSNATNADWTNLEPTLTWTAGTDSGGSLLGYCIALSETAIGGATPMDDPASAGGVLTGLDDGVTESYCPYIVSGTSLNLSSVTGLTLTSNKHYYISIKAVDTAGNSFSGSTTDYRNLLSFKYDGTAPTNVTSISAAGGSFSNIADMYFSWPTSGSIAASDSESGLLGYQYSLNDQTHWTGISTDSNTGLSIIPSATSIPFYFSVSRDSTQMIVGTNIIYFRSVDAAGNTSTPATYRTASIAYGGDAPTFAGNAAVTITPATATENSFALSWDAATPATNRTISSYYWMVNTAPPATLQTMIDNPGTYFAVTTTSVAASVLPAVVRGSNTVYIAVVDDLNNYSPSNYISGTFTLNTESPDAPKNLTVSDASIKSASLWRASLAWGTPDYIGLGNLLYSVQRSTDGTTWTTVGTTTGTAYVDTVTTSSRFYWRVGTQDSGGAGVATPTYTNSVTLIPKGTYTSAAELTSGPVVTGITTKKAKITWTTSRASDSKVSYGTSTGKYGDEEPSNSSQVTDHTINLSNLTPGTSYYYKAKWTDEDGNTGTSSEKSFSTQSAPIIKEVVVNNISLDSAIINFTTIHASSVKIYYGKTTDFGGAQTVETASTESSYTAVVTGLDDGTKYYFRLNGYDSEGSEYTGDIYSFETLPRPRVTNIELQQVAGTAETTILVKWQSNTEISSILTFYPDNNKSLSRDLIDLTLKKGEHSMLVSGLLPTTAYSLIVKGRDIMGNEASSAPTAFTTASDTRPPSIVNLKVIGGTIPPVGFAAGTINAQLVVTWDTDEPATSQVEYGEGTGSEYSSKTTEDGNLTTNHVVVISGLTPSQVYHVRAVSLDSAKNDGRSVDTVTIAPKATRSALDLVMSNLSQIFGNIRIPGN